MTDDRHRPLRRTRATDLSGATAQTAGMTRPATVSGTTASQEGVVVNLPSLWAEVVPA
ncbi:hypothetical protein L6E12_11075 [Actinokineospora sp. PR83]|uniref:hypothetical protein n=1 Tax=Actinokineospora sp. PR83 TaxID=2884908 RepID=UPI001F1C4FE5|nr:hypothetical protein [Actinokineospora sp. PR83]MCG8916332.1 hypothetical protein [Actinokineospora sp. PR83]